MTKQFEYELLIGNSASESYTTRREARQSKASYKQAGITDVEIIQRVWELVETDVEIMGRVWELVETKEVR